ncbi:MAG TPA: DUF4412 domain-containing protein [Gemmatimonadales bacterium]
MRTQHLMVAAVAVAAWLGIRPGSLVAQTGFNGVITFKQQDEDGKTSTFTQTTKGRKIRLDGMGGRESGAMIMDGDAHTMMMVSTSEKKAYVMTEEDAKQMGEMMGPMAERMKAKGDKGDDAKLSFKNTGRQETVAGVRCEVWHGTFDDGTGETKEGDACLAKGVGFALGEMMAANPMMRRDQHQLKQMEQFQSLTAGGKGVLKATSTKDGKTRVEFEATSIEPKTVSDDVFKAPAGYEEVRMADMMSQMRGAMKGMPQQHGHATPH